MKTQFINRFHQGIKGTVPRGGFPHVAEGHGQPAGMRPDRAERLPSKRRASGKGPQEVEPILGDAYLDHEAPVIALKNIGPITLAHEAGTPP